LSLNIFGWNILLFWNILNIERFYIGKSSCYNLVVFDKNEALENIECDRKSYKYQKHINIIKMEEETEKSLR